MHEKYEYGKSNLMRVEYLYDGTPGINTGIGRYTLSLHQYLKGKVTPVLAQPKFLPYSRHLSSLKNFPIGITNHSPGSILHFPKIMGSAMMLLNPIHPAVATVHDLGYLVCQEDNELFNMIDRKIFALQLRGLRCMDVICVNSEFTKISLIEKVSMPEEKIKFVQLGVDTKNFQPKPDAKKIIYERYGFECCSDVFYVIYVGSELPRKNFNLTINAVKILRTKGYPIEIIKIGGSGGEKWRERTEVFIQALGMEPFIHFFDFIEEKDLPLFYTVSNIAVTATLLEGGFAWLAMEAMACKTAVVASTMAQIPPDAQAGVCMVPSRDLDAVVEAIKKCFEDPTYTENLANKGYEIITQPMYSWETTAQEMISIYQDLQN